MTFDATLCTEEEIDQKSGANVSASFDNVMKTAAALQAEAKVCIITKYNFVDNWTAIDVDFKGIISGIVSSLAAIQAITYDMSGYTSRTEAEDMINMLDQEAIQGLALIRDSKNSDFIREI